MEVKIKPYETCDKRQVIGLWRDCGLVVPWNDPSRDIRRKLDVQPELFLVGWLAGQIVGTVMAGYDGHRGWINYLAVHPDHRHAGVGQGLMDAAEVRLRANGCPKINLQVRRTNTGVIEFYKKIGFNEDDVVSLGKRLEPDNEKSAVPVQPE